MARPLGAPGSPPPPRNSSVGEDALSAWLRADLTDDDAEADADASPPDARLEVGDQDRDNVISSVGAAGTSSVSDLRARTNLGQVQLGMVLERLRDDGVIRIEGAPGEEVVHKLDAAADGD